jgi:hypothetical protein
VTLATQDYRDKSDPLARFLRLCTEPTTRAGSSRPSCTRVRRLVQGRGREGMDPGRLRRRDGSTRASPRSERRDALGGAAADAAASDFVDAEGKVLANLPDLDADRGGGTARAIRHRRSPPPGRMTTISLLTLPDWKAGGTALAEGENGGNPRGWKGWKL